MQGYAARAIAIEIAIMNHNGFERARLYRLRKNSVSASVLKGHGFSRAVSAAE
jgi:hypothetical protein